MFDNQLENRQENSERSQQMQRFIQAWLVLGVVFFALRGFGSEGESQLPGASVSSGPSEAPLAQCENLMLGQDFEQRYQNLRSSLESDFQKGAPKKMRDELVGIRKSLDSLSVEVFSLESKNDQEYLHFTHQVLQALENLISALPKASALAPKIREQYVVPFTNLSSLKADYQDCLMKAALDQAQEQVQKQEMAQSAPSQPLAERNQIYKGLVLQLTDLNKSLYALETSNLQKLIDLRAEIALELEQLQTDNQRESLHARLSQKLPQYLNSAQNEVERVLPGLELSQEFYSYR